MSEISLKCLESVAPTTDHGVTSTVGYISEIVLCKVLYPKELVLDTVEGSELNFFCLTVTRLSLIVCLTRSITEAIVSSDIILKFTVARAVWGIILSFAPLLNIVVVTLACTALYSFVRPTLKQSKKI